MVNGRWQSLPLCHLPFAIYHVPFAIYHSRLPSIVGEADAEAVAVVLRPVGVPRATPRAVAVEQPAAAADDAQRTSAGADRVGGRDVRVRAVLILRPLPDVARHIE